MGEYKNIRNTEIYTKRNLVDQPVANLIINHGFAEHLDRYDHVAEYFNKRNISVFRYDLRGHGRTKTSKGDIEAFSDYIEDLDLLVEGIKREFPDQALFMLGHSMGGLITCIYGITKQDKLAGQLFSGPAVIRANEAKGYKGSLLKLVAKFSPEMRIKNSLTSDICTVDSVVKDYMEDPLILKDATARFMKEFQIEATDFVKANIKNYKYPCFIAHGEKDNIIAKEASIYLYNSISSQSKEIKIYDGLYHEIFNEEMGPKIVSDMADWIYKNV